MTVASIAASAASAAQQAQASRQQGKAQKALNDYNADLAAQEAMVRERDSAAAAKVAQSEADRNLARQRALYAAAGVETTSGSPLLASVVQASEYQRQISDIYRSSQTDAAKLRSQGAIDRLAGQSALSAGGAAATGSILQGVASGTGRAASAIK
jgi:hypothetical protein